MLTREEKDKFEEYVESLSSKSKEIPPRKKKDWIEQQKIVYLQNIARQKKMIVDDWKWYRCQNCGTLIVQAVLVRDEEYFEYVQKDEDDWVSRDVLVQGKRRTCYCRICGDIIGHDPKLLPYEIYREKLHAELDKKYPGWRLTSGALHNAIKGL